MRGCMTMFRQSARIFAALFFASTLAHAAPAPLASDADAAALAQRIKTYAGASRVRWVVAGHTLSAAHAAIASVALHLDGSDQNLLSRVRAETFADSGDTDSGPPQAWIEPQLGKAPGSCAWQVWVFDPDAPSAGASALSVPLSNNDRLPVGAAATFRIGYAGLLQSRLYAFGETEPGAIRDLAISPDVNIPVAESGVETIVLAISRQPAPYLERIRTALASSAGQRRELGRDFALRGNLLGPGRGIGANIQVVGPNMVLAKDDKAAAPSRPELDPSELAETCQFSLMSAAKATQ